MVGSTPMTTIARSPKSCGTSFNTELAPSDVVPAAGASPRHCLASGLLKERTRARRFVLAPERLRPNALHEMLARLKPYTFSFASPHALRGAIYRLFADTFARGAVEGLASRQPDRSARSKSALWQRLAAVLGPLALLGALAIAPAGTIWLLTVVLVVLFVPVIALRLVAVFRLMRSKAHDGGRARFRAPDAELPVYTVLVPLYREAHMLKPLIHTLTRLDWPAAKLDIKLILEAVDAPTIAAARALHLPGNIEIVVVPDLKPRTKPKALNYALPLARGEYLVIYDAEDRPDRDQLRLAFHAFSSGEPNLATVQARLNIYNASDNWLTRQFTIEYCALFDGLMPALDDLRLPIPLGGTSNHFRVSALKWLMAWDPFNVTEDADLGMRLARNCYRCAMLNSTTFEEAPRNLMSWLRQRTRWLKGYIQTWLVHMRFPHQLWRELGPRGFLAFQVVVGGTVLSALVHPWFYALAGIEIAQWSLLARPEDLLGWPFWVIAWFDLLTGYLASMALGFLAVRGRGYRHHLTHVLLMPFYWLLISVAAYRALWQFMTARYEWEKTEHSLMPCPTPPAPR